jgi:rod shape-determining protein MreC
MSSSVSQQKAPGVLALLLLSQVVLMSLSARHPNTDQSILRTWVMAGLTPVVKVASGALSAVSGAVASLIDLKNARRENLELRQQLEQVTAERDQARERAAEYERLRSTLGLPSLPQYHRIPANVISRDPSLWFRRLIIDRGTLDGVKLNMPVVTATGIVGRIVQVGPNFAQVQLITDRHAGVGAILQQSREPGEVRGLDNARCELKNIPASVSVQIGEAIVTTGWDGIYPKGLMVGTVERIESDPNTPWHKIIVNPSAQIDRVEAVYVILIEPKDLKAQEAIR